jgi:hypothetical protein
VRTRFGGVNPVVIHARAGPGRADTPARALRVPDGERRASRVTLPPPAGPPSDR